MNKQCLPLWGKWIEIFSELITGKKSQVSSPVGEVDWNKWKFVPYDTGSACLPLWGKWIEMPLRISLATFRTVSSPVGEVDWNVKSVTSKYNSLPVSSPVGEVDWNIISADGKVKAEVSSPVGEVDWNFRPSALGAGGVRVFPCGGSGLKFPFPVCGNNCLRCLPRWGKWIEIKKTVDKWCPSVVSSPVGEVDWNAMRQNIEYIGTRVFPCGGSGLK